MNFNDLMAKVAFRCPFAISIACSVVELESRVRDHIGQDSVTGSIESSRFKLKRASFKPLEISTVSGRIGTSGDDEAIVEGEIESLWVWNAWSALVILQLVVTIPLVLFQVWPIGSLIGIAAAFGGTLWARHFMLKQATAFWSEWLRNCGRK